MQGQLVVGSVGAAGRKLFVAALGRRARWFVLGAATGVAVLGLVGSLLMPGHRSAWPGEAWFGGMVLGVVGPVSADTPPKPTVDQALLTLGKYNYSQQRCWFCHADVRDGQAVAPNAAHVFPPPRNFARGDASGRSDETLYWAIDEGVAFTSMPSFGSRMTTDDIWSIVVYIQAMSEGAAEAIPQITPTPTR
jgi:hypothetical protein